jgi:hypothetical protein
MLPFDKLVSNFIARAQYGVVRDAPDPRQVWKKAFFFSKLSQPPFILFNECH